MSGLSGTPLRIDEGFNWVYQVELLVCCVLTIFFLFYFNRLFATLVSYAIRAFTWHKYHAYIDIQAIQISLLAGRIFFKDLRYHGHNQTILVHGGYITWQYWLRKVRDTDVFTPKHSSRSQDQSASSGAEASEGESRSRSLGNEEKGNIRNSNTNLPCRIAIKVSGVEVFLYNRSPVYDAILGNIARKREHERSQGGPAGTREDEQLSEFLDGSKDQKKKQGKEYGVDLDAATQESVVESKKPDEPPAFLKLFPIHVDCNKGAVALGNENTTSVITAQFERASGEFDATQSGPLDVYQQLFNFEVTHPVVHMRKNHDFKSYQLDTAARLKKEAVHGELPETKETTREKKKKIDWKLFNPFTYSLWNTSMSSIKTASVNTASNGRQSPVKPWQGLPRYMHDALNDEHDEWGGVEYGNTSMIVDCPRIRMSFYWDVPGPVTEKEELTASGLVSEDINGAYPPAYGMDLHVFGGTINYGPWADRQRVNIQNIFVPANHVDAVPAEPLMIGQSRVPTNFKIFIAIEDDTTLRIPMREPSKDWKWKGKASDLLGKGDEQPKDKNRSRGKMLSGRKKNDKGVGATVRPFAWLDVKILADSTVTYNMDMYARKDGYHNDLSVDLRGTEISSSVNHALLWKSGNLSVLSDMSNPLGWNALRKWSFDVKVNDLDLFILRDHLFLVTDLVSDWGAGSAPNYFTFVPFQYLLTVDFNNFKMFLNTNDSNIINNPTELNENNFIILFGHHLHGEVTIPLDRYRPAQNEIPFDVTGTDLGLDMCMPPGNTLKTFVRSPHVARLGNLKMTGSHTQFTTTAPNLTDRLYFNIHGGNFSLVLFGFLIKHLLTLKENYFGEDLHFKTLEEYQNLQPGGSMADNPEDHNEHHNKSNDLDVILSITASECNALLPSNLYSADHGIRVDVPYASVDLRFTNYYMDMEANFSPLSISLGGIPVNPGAPVDSAGPTEIYIASANMIGHRLFGLPPKEPTYLCNWDLTIGDILGECSIELMQELASGAGSFAFSLDDNENALPILNPLILHDVTFLRLRTSLIQVWLRVEHEAILIRSEPINLEFNDWAGHLFSQRLKLDAPKLTVACVDGSSSVRSRTQNNKRQTAQTYAYFDTAISINMLKRKLGFTADRDVQQEHIHLHDERTRRTEFLAIAEQNQTLLRSQSFHNTNPPAMIFPPVPLPLNATSRSSLVSSTRSSKNSFSSIRKSLTNQTLQGSTSAGENSTNSLRERCSPNRTPSAQIRKERGHLSLSSISVGVSDLGKEEPLHSSFALSGSLAIPSFPMHQVEPDLSDVEPLPITFIEQDDARKDDPGELPLDSANHLDENFVHTSLIITTGQGIRLHGTPKAVSTIAHVLNSILPKNPETILDAMQVMTLSEILDKKERKEGKGKSTEISLKIPQIHVRFCHSSTIKTNYGTSLQTDEYDMLVKNCRLLLRDKVYPRQEEQDNPFKSLSVHTTFSSLDISLKEKIGGVELDDTAISIRLNDFLLWISQARTNSINVTLRDLSVVNYSRKIEYLASLIHRTTILADESQTLFRQGISDWKARLRYIVYILTDAGRETADPMFLTRASYAGRVGPDHLRNQDSWKILSRLRFILWELEPEQKHKLIEDCREQSHVCPANSREDILSRWDQWRTWDLRSVKQSLLMQRLYGPFENGFNIDEPVEIPLQLSFKAASIRVLIDPGLKQTEFGTKLLSVTGTLEPPPTPSGLHLVENPSRKTRVLVNTRHTLLNVNWEICELMERVLSLFQRDQRASTKKEIITSPPKPSDTPSTSKGPQDDFQLLFVTENGLINLDCINVTLKCHSENMKISLAGFRAPASSDGLYISGLAHADESGVELKSRGRQLVRTRADAPVLYVSSHIGRLEPDELRIAGVCKSTAVEISEDVLGLIEIADAVIINEVSFVQRMIGKLQTERTTSERAESAQIPNLTVSLLMDSYTVSLAILPSLKYSIAGGIGRIAVHPMMGHERKLTLDFDLDGHRHSFRDRADSHIISSLEFPPVNGRIVIRHAAQQMSLDLVGTVELITLDASSIHGLLNIAKNPEISHLIRAIEGDIEVLKSHVTDVFPEAPDANTNKIQGHEQALIYKIKLTMEGIQIFANAPTQYAGSTTATLVAGLEHTQLNILNVSKESGNVLEFPNISAEVQKMGVSLTLVGNNARQRCGNISLGATVRITSADASSGSSKQIYRVSSSGLEVNIHAETASAVVDVMNHLQDRLKDVDFSKEKKYLRRLRQSQSHGVLQDSKANSTNDKTAMIDSSGVFTSTFSLELLNIQICWVVGDSAPTYSERIPEDLVLSFRRIDLSTRTEETARLMIEDMQLQMVPPTFEKGKRSLNSALLPEVVFNVAYSSSKGDRKLAFHAAGKSLDLQLESKFVLPAKSLEQSINLAIQKFRAASANWQQTPTATGVPRNNPFGNKRLSSLLVDADFAGAVVNLRAASYETTQTGSQRAIVQRGKYGQFVSDGSTTSTSLRAPGIAFKVEFKDNGRESSLNAELKVDASTNALYPTVVPLIVDISNSIKEVVKDKNDEEDRDENDNENDAVTKTKAIGQKLIDEDSLITADPSAILGKTRLNFGFRICKQEFSLSCQPIARVAATTRIDDIYMTMSSVKTKDHGHFFAISAAFEKLQASVQHVYSKESTFSFNVESIYLSLMNSKHLSGKSGVSAILKINPIRTHINARQLQDFLLFREIWVPPEVRQQARQTPSVPTAEPQEYLVQRYHQVASAAAFPWNATFAIAEMKVELDLGQAIGKSALIISNLWASSKKNSDWEQNLCVGVDKIGINSTGRMNGTVALAGVKVRTSIRWPEKADAGLHTPFIQASAGFKSLKAKIGFDYQVFAAADITDFEFLMYNVRQGEGRDRLVAILDGDKVQVFLTSTSSAQVVALYQAVQRLIQENQSAYMQSLKDIERFLRRQSSVTTHTSAQSQPSRPSQVEKQDKISVAPISLGTDVVVTLKKITFAAFPSSLSDSQVLSLEASNVQARFAAALDDDVMKGVQVHSALGLTLGHLSVALASISQSSRKEASGEVTVESIVNSVATAKGGTILRVPKVLATMQTWQAPESNYIEYQFKSSFEGKVDVGWNYSRIASIRNMYNSHTRALASRLGKPLPEPAVRISAPTEKPTPGTADSEKEKITAVVNVPQSRYEYRPLGEVVIETPQLRDMGEATPPLEWIGLHRDRLPNVTHQVVIVPLLEVAKEVEDAYQKILGTS